jgi:uncharacterized protein YbaR (Trm112 family)
MAEWMINQELIDILCCPHCKGNVRYKQEKSVLVCEQCGRIYEVKDDIPVMIIEHDEC